MCLISGSCGPGRIQVGHACEDVDECAWQPCLHGGTCYNLQSGHKCVCGPSHVGDHCQWPHSGPNTGPLGSPGTITAFSVAILLMGQPQFLLKLMIFLESPRHTVTISYFLLRVFTNHSSFILPVLLLTVLSRHLARHFCRGSPRGGKGTEEQATGREAKGGVTEGGGERNIRKDGPQGPFLKDFECRITGGDHAVWQSEGEGGPGTSYLKAMEQENLPQFELK